jgi:hypothetical protein
MDEALTPTGLELEMSTDSEFSRALVKATHTFSNIAPDATAFTPPTPNPVSSAPLCDQVVYFRLRAVSSEENSVGAWSATSAAWLSTSNDDCDRSTQYLDCSVSNNPRDWACAACPVGGHCVGPVRWTQVKAAAGFWRDDRVAATPGADETDLVPRDHKFVRCANKAACEGGGDGGGVNGTDIEVEQCKEGYKQICDAQTNGTCRMCRTCAKGYAMLSDGITCELCPKENSEDRKIAISLALLLSLAVLCIFSFLVFLHVRSGIVKETPATRAAHQTIKRIVLSHMQVVFLCLGLNVPWPRMVMQLMVAFSSISSVSQHVAQVGCFVDTENPVRKQSRFLYASSLSLALFPVVFGMLLWVYWMMLVPLRCCRCLSCGRKAHLTMSDPVPNACRRLYRKVFGCGGRSSGRDDMPASDAMSSTPNPLPSIDGLQTGRRKSDILRRQVTQQDLEEEDTDLGRAYLKFGTPEQLEARKEARRKEAVQRILENKQLKTRDIWVYSTVLFFCKFGPQCLHLAQVFVFLCPPH